MNNKAKEQWSKRVSEHRVMKEAISKGANNENVRQPENKKRV